MTTPPTHTDRSHGDHDHDRGLAFDLARMDELRVGRRRALRWFGGVGTAALATACGGGSSGAGSESVGSTPTPTPSATATATPTPTPSATATSGSCTVPASETNGPYPADGTNTSAGLTSNALTASGVVRTDIRSSFVGSSTTTAPGVATTLTITVVDANNACAPLAGYAVYVWACDATGLYSLYNLPNESYLRGVQVTDANGQCTFTMIVPGCYEGRYPHIHFEVFSSLANATTGRSARLISQFAIPAAVCTAVYAGASGTYGQSASRFARTSIASDGIFGDNTAAQNAVMTLTMTGSVAGGYTASTVIGIAT